MLFDNINLFFTGAMSQAISTNSALGIVITVLTFFIFFVWHNYTKLNLPSGYLVLGIVFIP
jgi:hypothetical protein